MKLVISLYEAVAPSTMVTTAVVIKRVHGMDILVGLVGSATLLQGSLSLLVTSANTFQSG